VMPTKLPLKEFYEELVKTQEIINRKFMGWKTAVAVSKILAGQLARGQTNFLKMLFKFSKVYNVDRFYQDHFNEVKYAMRRPEEYDHKLSPSELLVHEKPVTLTYGRSSKVTDSPLDQASPVA